MELQSSFINCDSLAYETLIDELKINLSDITIEELDYLNNLGFDLVISKGIVNIQGELEIVAKFLKEEIEQNLVDQDEFHRLADYVAYTFYNDLTFITEVAQAIVSTKALKGWSIRIYDVFEYISDNWILTEKQTKELRAQEWEDYQEKKHPDDK